MRLLKNIDAHQTDLYKCTCVYVCLQTTGCLVNSVDPGQSPHCGSTLFAQVFLKINRVMNYDYNFRMKTYLDILAMVAKLPLRILARDLE